MESNIHSDMSELVHLAKKWASESSPPQGLENIPQISIQDFRAREIGRQIITRAALKLLHQLGIKSQEDFKKHFGDKEGNEVKVIVKEEHPSVIVPVSPMSAGEFSSILERGWHSEALGSPNRRRTSMLNEIVPLSPIASEEKQISTEKKFAMPQTMRRKSEAPISSRKLFTPKASRIKEAPRGSITPSQKRAEMTTPQRTTTMDRFSPPPSQSETPFENRASRLRRLKLEEKRKSLGGNSSMNLSFGCQ